MGKLHRVARTGVGGRNPTIREINIKQFVHVSHDDHVTIEEDDPLRGSLSAAHKIGRGRTSKSARPNPLRRLSVNLRYATEG